jgi:hypothetical protein
MIYFIPETTETFFVTFKKFGDILKNISKFKKLNELGNDNKKKI